VTGEKSLPQLIQFIAVAPTQPDFLDNVPRGLDEEHCGLVESILAGESLEQVSLAARELMCFAKIGE
jgi:hypothetical protein